MLWAILIIAVLLVVIEIALARRRAAPPRTPSACIRLGQKALDAGDSTRAADLFREAIRLDYRSAEAHFYLATAAWQLDDLEQAIASLEASLRWEPLSPATYHNLALAYQRKGDTERAIWHYQQALQLHPQEEGTRHRLAALYHELGRHDQAKAVCPDFQPLDEQEQQAQRVWEQLDARALTRLRRWDKAVEVFLTAYRVSRIGALAYVALSLLTALYGLATRSRQWREPNVGPLLAIAFGAAMAVMWISLLALRLMESHRDRFLRRVMLQSGVPKGEVEAVLPPHPGPPWWKVELSGLHLLLWLGLLGIVIALRGKPSLPGWADAFVAYIILAWVFKAGFLLGLFLVPPERRGAWHRPYRWFGTLRGTFVGLVAVPVMVFAFGLLLIAIVELVGR